MIYVLPLAACQTVAIDAKFPEVPKDIVACSKIGLADVPARDLTVAEVETAWKGDRYVALQKGKCLNRLIVRDQKLARQ